MAGMWATPVGTAESFEQDLANLKGKYGDLPRYVAAFKEALANNPKLPHIQHDKENDVYTQLLDYPPLGPAGIQLFRISYWAPPSHEANPWQRFTLISIVERNPQAEVEREGSA